MRRIATLALARRNLFGSLRPHGDPWIRRFPDEAGEQVTRSDYRCRDVGVDGRSMGSYCRPGGF